MTHHELLLLLLLLVVLMVVPPLPLAGLGGGQGEVQLILLVCDRRKKPNRLVHCSSDCYTISQQSTAKKLNELFWEREGKRGGEEREKERE